MVDARRILGRRGITPGIPHVTTENTSLSQFVDAVRQQLSNLGSLRSTLDSLRNSGLLSASGELIGTGDRDGSPSPWGS